MEWLTNRSGILSAYVSDREAECSSCALPRRAAGKLMVIPGLAGQFCSVLCAEQAIYERGCRWCGVKPESARYCSESCHRKALHYCAGDRSFGDGARPREWLRRRGENLIAVPAAVGVVCQHCGESLSGRRGDALFSSHRCQMAFFRAQGAGIRRAKKGRLSVTTA
jgi:YgiT-type zinc finger domain-containing protein